MSQQGNSLSQHRGSHAWGHRILPNPEFRQPCDAQLNCEVSDPGLPAIDEVCNWLRVVVERFPRLEVQGQQFAELQFEYASRSMEGA